MKGDQSLQSGPMLISTRKTSSGKKLLGLQTQADNAKSGTLDRSPLMVKLPLLSSKDKGVKTVQAQGGSTRDSPSDAQAATTTTSFYTKPTSAIFKFCPNRNLSPQSNPHSNNKSTEVFRATDGKRVRKAAGTKKSGKEFVIGGSKGLVGSLEKEATGVEISTEKRTRVDKDNRSKKTIFGSKTVLPTPLDVHTDGKNAQNARARSNKRPTLSWKMSEVPGMKTEGVPEAALEPAISSNGDRRQNVVLDIKDELGVDTSIGSKTTKRRSPSPLQAPAEPSPGGRKTANTKRRLAEAVELEQELQIVNEPATKRKRLNGAGSPVDQKDENVGGGNSGSGNGNGLEGVAVKEEKGEDITERDMNFENEPPEGNENETETGGNQPVNEASVQPENGGYRSGETKDDANEQVGMEPGKNGEVDGIGGDSLRCEESIELGDADVVQDENREEGEGERAVSNTEDDDGSVLPSEEDLTKQKEEDDETDERKDLEARLLCSEEETIDDAGEEEEKHGNDGAVKDEALLVANEADLLCNESLDPEGGNSRDAEHPPSIANKNPPHVENSPHPSTTFEQRAMFSRTHDVGGQQGFGAYGTMRVFSGVVSSNQMGVLHHPPVQGGSSIGHGMQGHGWSAGPHGQSIYVQRGYVPSNPHLAMNVPSTQHGPQSLAQNMIMHNMGQQGPVPRFHFNGQPLAQRPPETGHCGCCGHIVSGPLMCYRCMSLFHPLCAEPPIREEDRPQVWVCSACRPKAADTNGPDDPNQPNAWVAATLLLQTRNPTEFRLPKWHCRLVGTSKQVSGEVKDQDLTWRAKILLDKEPRPSPWVPPPTPPPKSTTPASQITTSNVHKKQNTGEAQKKQGQNNTPKKSSTQEPQKKTPPNDTPKKQNSAGQDAGKKQNVPKVKPAEVESKKEREEEVVNPSRQQPVVVEEQSVPDESDVASNQEANGRKRKRGLPSCFVCGRNKNNDNGDMVNCSECPLSYHAGCADPPILGAIPPNWICPNHGRQRIAPKPSRPQKRKKPLYPLVSVCLDFTDQPPKVGQPSREDEDAARALLHMRGIPHVWVNDSTPVADGQTGGPAPAQGMEAERERLHGLFEKFFEWKRQQAQSVGTVKTGVEQQVAS